METTAKILEKFAPQFLALYEAELELLKLLSIAPVEESKAYPIVSQFYQETRNQTRALLDAYAQALVLLAKLEPQPIETAPKDGAKILLYYPEGVFIGFWSTALNYWLAWFPGSQKPPEPPTHWAPIQALPKQEGA